MISWNTSRTTIGNAEANGVVTCRRLFLFFLLSINIYSQVACSGVFQLHLLSFANDKGQDNESRCCDGQPPMDGSDICHSPCRTFFWVCLRHFQHRLPTTDVQCTYGETTTEVLGLNSFNDSDNEAKYLVEIPFDFTWPGSFSLFVKAWHDLTGAEPYEGSSRTLVAEFAIKKLLNVSEGWRPDVFVGNRFRLDYSYRVICGENYVGPGCSEKCTPRNDSHGHYNCSHNESRVCHPGWTGEYCRTAICLDGCNMTNGYCDVPFECKCRPGWKGPTCDECKTHPSCSHGGCSDRWQCNCFEGWGGLYCNQDLNFCTNNAPCSNGATCKNTGEGSYTCLCPPEYTGTNCEIEIFDCYRNACVNGGVCEKSNGQHRCRCPEGFSGRRCETKARSCHDYPCENLGVCHPLDEGQQMGYRCDCQPGFTGSNCEVDVNECHSAPCLNDGRCIDERGLFRCVCAAGFTGDRCERDRSDCHDSPCLNGGSCIDGVDHFLCRCARGFTGDLCQDDVDDCMTHPCANGGTCLDRNNAFVCQCLEGFTGRDCGVNVDECRSGPCLRGACRDLINGYRCHCDAGYTGTNCDSRLPFRTPSPVHVATLSDEMPDTGNVSSTPSDPISPEAEVPTDGYIRQTVLVVCLGLLLTLLILCSAVVALVLHRRSRRRARTVRDPPSQKMNNAQHLEGGHEPDKAMGVKQNHQNQQRCSEFAAREHLQHSINHTNNLKNVEKCPTQKQKMFAWDTGPESNAVKSTDYYSPESRTNRNKTDKSNTWKHSDTTTSAPSNVVSGSLHYFRQDPKIFSDGVIATEV